MRRSRRYCAERTHAESVGTRRSAEPRNQRTGRPAKKSIAPGDHEVRERGSEVRLEEDEAGGHDDEAEDGQERPRREVHLVLAAREERRERDHERDLHELGGLNGHEAEREPAARPVDRRAEEHDDEGGREDRRGGPR